MNDYISREAALARLRKIVEVNRLRTDRAWFTPDGVEYLINEIPAADVRPVVYCQDCIHLGFKDFNGICNGPMCGVVKPWDYCSHGLRGGDT